MNIEINQYGKTYRGLKKTKQTNIAYPEFLGVLTV